jgi:hypothetical protein
MKIIKKKESVFCPRLLKLKVNLKEFLKLYTNIGLKNDQIYVKDHISNQGRASIF